ncbi:clostripain-related cysteine peptidase [Anaerolineales bacterium HSG6]|nr:clostripain-related cysteine peptidase [Anaerolineales bacterium HSG6]
MMKNLTNVLLAVMLFVGIAVVTMPSAQAQTGTVDLIGQIGGVTNAVFVKGNTAYIGVGPRLVILDISDPSNPTKLGESAVLPEVVQDVYVSGNYAYVANGLSGLQIINISNPAAPTLSGSCDTSDLAVGVTVSGSYAYVADYGSGLQVINISNPVAPTLSGGYDTSGTAYGVTVSGSYAYVADYYSLQVINISNPTTPTMSGSYDTPGIARGVTVSGNYAYVADDSSGLQVINISNPTTPTLSGSYDTSGYARGVTVSGSYAYIADYNGGLQVINISNPSLPTLSGSYNTSGSARGVVVSGSYAYVANSGLQVINISNPTALTLSGSYDTLVSAIRGITVSGSYAYVVSGAGCDLQVINISNPSLPTLVSSYDTPGLARSVTVSGSYAYVADDSSGLQVINISNPVAPSLSGSYNTPGGANDVTVSGSYAYVADGYSGLQVINISNPASPSLSGSYDTPSFAFDVTVSGSYAYVADQSGGLQVINISNPAAPTLVSSYDTFAYDVTVSGSYAYVAGYGLQVIDISNPAMPTLVGNATSANRVTVSGSYAYVVNGAGYGLQVINISNPSLPTLSGSYDTSGRAHDVTVSGNYVYVADSAGGLYILRFNEPILTVPECLGVTEIPQAECEALVVLYDSTDGDNWTDNTGWKITNTPCSWYGVSCSGGNVTSLRLDRNQLTGTIPTELGNLANLTGLYLYENQLTGTIPTELGNLVNLTELRLNSNQLTGTIPTELGNLVNLPSLNLSYNQLTGTIPTELGNLVNLTSLSLKKNQLTGTIPTELGNLVNLTELSLGNNQLTGTIPTELGNLVNLTELGLYINQLTGTIPTELGNLVNLTSLWLDRNQLTGTIPTELGNLVNLTRLSLFSNQLTGTIPTEFGSNLVNLTQLFLYSNQLTGTIPTVLGNLVNLTSLDLGNNQLTGTIPTELGNLVNLQWFRLHNNQLSGTIPDLSNLTKLGAPKVDFGNNQLTNEFAGSATVRDPDWRNTQTIPPTDLSTTVQSDTSIQVAWTPITYTSDAGYYQVKYSTTSGGSYTNASSTTTNKSATNYDVTGLTPGTTYYFVVETFTPKHGDQQNDLTSELSVEVSATTDATLFSCSTQTEIPQAECETLVVLYDSTDGANWKDNTGWKDTNTPCSWNGISCSNGHLQQLDLHSNQLNGNIPTELGNLSNLQKLSLYNNQLNGNIPAELGNLTNLLWLDLYTNQLSSNIPAKLGNLTNLQGLSLSANQLSGNIPAKLGDLSNLQWLYLNNNQLSGNIPAELGDLINLQQLDLRSNQLSGNIPAELGDLSNLQELHLNNNQLSGNIPAELGNLSNLQWLYLNNNQLSGNIPAELGNLSNLQGLHLEYNQLSDSIGELENLNNLRGLYFSQTDLCEPTDTSFQDWLSGVNNVLSTGIKCEAESPAFCDSVVEIPKAECEALVALYDSTDGDNWTDNTGWKDTNTPCSWYKVACNSGHVSSIDLPLNQLSGKIPSELGNFLSLQWLDLSQNQLSGDIPLELTELGEIEKISLWRNQLTGKIPSEFSKLQKIQIIDLSENQLIGDIPPVLGNIESLQWLRLHNNKLTGIIPIELFNLDKLQILSVANNQLTGIVPPELGNLTNLERLFLSNNQFSNSLPQSLINLDKLSYFWFDSTDLCEPTDTTFQNWLANINNLQSTDVQCESEPVAPASVAINGQTTVMLDTSSVFTASVAPISSTMPITYVWQATGQNTVTYLTNGRIDTVPFTWNTTGQKVITVTAINDGGKVSDTHELVITTPAVPLLTSISPNSAVANAGNLPVIIYGEDLQAPITATIGNVSLLTPTLIGTTTLHAMLPVGSLSEGLYDLTVSSNGQTMTLNNAFTVEPAVAEKQFRAMVVFACDNNLESSCETAFNQLEATMSSNPDLQIVVLWDGHVDGDSAYYLIQPDDNPYQRFKYTEDLNKFSKGELDTALPNTLVEFASWAQSQYPGKFTFLSLVGHGGGWGHPIYPGQGRHSDWGGGPTFTGGMLWDAHPKNTMPTEPMTGALKWLTMDNPLDVIYLDSCLMSGVEVMSSIAPYAEYIIAHENLTWAIYPYHDYLKQVDGNTQPEALAEHIAQSFIENLPTNNPAQIGVIDTSRMPKVELTLDALSISLSHTLTTSRSAISQSLIAAMHLEENEDWWINQNDDYVDAYDFATQLIAHDDIPANVKTDAQELQQAITETMLVNHAKDGVAWPSYQAGYNHPQTWTLSRLEGLSLYFPLEDDWRRPHYGADALPTFAGKTHWDEFIQAWHKDSVAPDPDECEDGNDDDTDDGWYNCLRVPVSQPTISLDPPDLAPVDSIVWVPVTLNNITVTDDIRSITVTVKSADNNILQPACDTDPREGQNNILPNGIVTSTNCTVDGWHYAISESSTAISDIGSMIELPFYSQASGEVTVYFGDHQLSNEAAEPILHEAIAGWTVISSMTDTQLQIAGSPVILGVGETGFISLIVKPGENQVNGVQIHGRVDPTFLRIIDVQGVTEGLPVVLEGATFDPTTGQFRYSAGLVGNTITETFEVLKLEVEALKETEGTRVEFLEDSPATAVSGPEGSIETVIQPGLVVISSQAWLVGSVDMQGRPTQPHVAWSIPLTVTMTSVADSNVVETFEVMTGQYGQFRLNGFTPGVWDITVKGSHTLRNLAQNVKLSADVNRYNFGKLLEGDVENKDSFNQVVMPDFGVLSGSYNKCNGDAGFVANANLDEVDCVAVADFGLLSGNFNTQGDIEVTASSARARTRRIVATEGLAQLSFSKTDLTVAVNKVVTVNVVIDPQGQAVNGATVHLRFDPTLVEITDVTPTDRLNIPLEAPIVDNEQGVIRFARGLLGDTISETFTIATLSFRLKGKTEGTDITPVDTFPATDVSGPTGSVLAGTDNLSLKSKPQIYLPIIAR